MSHHRRLHDYIASLRRRLQWRAGLRGTAVVAATALLVTLALALVLNHYAFPRSGISAGRLSLVAALVVAVVCGLVWPLLRATKSRAIAAAGRAHPELQDRLLTFQQREAVTPGPFLDLLAADTLAHTAAAPPRSLAPTPALALFAGIAAACTACLLWLVIAAPGTIGYGAALLWRGQKPHAQPLYALTIAPGNVTVRRNGDQLITAQLQNLHPDAVRLFARFAGKGGWDPVSMQLVPSANGNATYSFGFTGLPGDVDYYVTAGPLTSPQYTVHVVDLPAVKSVKVTYRYPAWTGLKAETHDPAGDLRAIEGTEADLQVEMDHPLNSGNLTLDDGRVIALSALGNNRYRGAIPMRKDGAYHVAATAEGQPVRLSEDYFIATDKAEPPSIAISKPGRDYRASPIEEVTIGIKGGAQFGLRDMHLHYSVNGGPDQDLSLLKQGGAHDADASHTIRLEDFRLHPGDFISLYATARDGHAEAKTDIAFIQADPYEREFSQSQQGGGGGGGGGGQQGGNQTEISRREKELIAQTWKQSNDKSATEKSAKTQGDFLADAQNKLRDQVNALSVRINSRSLSEANEEFTSFEKDMREAAKNMQPASEKLAGTQWSDALVSEQKALQALLRAEATFRQIQVAFGQQGGGGGGGGNSTGRDLASLFDLELDTEKNQYETARSSSPEEEHGKQVEDALSKLDALAKRQEELAAQQKNPQQAFQQRWQQEMLRREAEQLQRQMEQLQQQNAQRGNASQGSSGQSSSQSSSSGKGGQSGSGSASSSASDQRVEQALNRMRSAGEAMRRAGNSGAEQQAQREAASRLREATGLLGAAQGSLAGNRVTQLAHEGDRLQNEQRAQSERIDNFTKSTQNREFKPQEIQSLVRQRNQLAADRQELSNGLSQLQRRMRDAATGMAGSQPDAAKKLRDALSEMDSSDLDNRMQRTADWLRSGVNPNSNGTEKNIAEGLGKLSQQLRSAAGSVSPSGGQRGTGSAPADQTAALGQVERLRSQLQAMQASRQGGKGSSPNGQGKGEAGGQGTGRGTGQANGQSMGDLGDRTGGGGSTEPARSGVNSGNNTYAGGNRFGAKDTGDNPADTQRTFEQGMRQLGALRSLVKGDPQAQKDLEELTRSMAGLDPRRFPGNPAMVEQMHSDVLRAVDKLELQLQRSSTTSAHTGRPDAVPAGYNDSVAEYYRRLSKGSAR